MDYSNAISALKQADPILRSVLDLVGPCTLSQNQRKGDWRYALSESILHQQLSTKVAMVMHQRFLQLYPSMPTALDILNTTDEYRGPKFSDLGIRTSILRIYGLAKLPDKKTVEKIG